MNLPFEKPIALALSGGGIRAMVFHLGVMRYLSERGLLERVTHVSSVSGGSLIIGLTFVESQMKWPTSRQFLDKVYPALRTKLCARSLQWGAARQLSRPRNWRFILSRANALSAALHHEWQITGSLADLPAMPEWSINGTNAENGRRFRFKKNNFGDYLTGYTPSVGFPLADAMAVSAAFPGGFGPLTLRTDDYVWRKRLRWNAPEGSEEPVAPPYFRLHLYDGGVYDNLGLEPFFDAGQGKSKLPDHFIFASDAGLPLTDGFSGGPINPLRLRRVADIMSDQARALRVRTFVHFIMQSPGRGTFAFIGCPADAVDASIAKIAKAYPTTLRRIDSATFDDIARHGFEAASSGHGI